jgi:hypothetical protein
MVFGGTRVNRFWSEDAYAYLAGLPLADARVITAKHPDFYLCASPGAALARNAMVDFFLVATEAGMRDRIDRAIRDHQARFERDGQRLCVTLAGRRLWRTSYKIDGQESRLTEVTPFTYVAVEDFDADDCRPLLESRARD